MVALYQDLNARYFDAALPLVPVYRGIPADASERADLNGLTRLNGYGSWASLTIYLSDDLFDVSHPNEEVTWNLLHEMVHLAVYLDALGNAHPFEDHHGEHFTAECNRIGRREKWGDVRPSDAAHDETDDAAAWPDNVWPD